MTVNQCKNGLRWARLQRHESLDDVVAAMEFQTEERMVDMISLQGYADTPENQACMEWERFYSEYTADRTFI